MLSAQNISGRYHWPIGLPPRLKPVGTLKKETPPAALRRPAGEVGDEGWFALTSTPDSWTAAGPSSDGIQNFVQAGPGLGSPDANGDREALLDKIPGVTPLRAEGLALLVGLSVCNVVFDSDVSINYDPIDGSLNCFAGNIFFRGRFCNA